MAIGQSQTLQQVRRLAAYLPRRLRRQILSLIPFSIIPGVLDAASIAVVARMMQTLLGSKFNQNLPFIPALGSDRFEQTIWLIFFFVLFSWLRSISRLGVLAIQERLTGKVWLYLTNTIYARILSRPT